MAVKYLGNNVLRQRVYNRIPIWKINHEVVESE